MSDDSRENAARQKLLELFGTEDGEYGPTLFVTHHKKELGPDYWKDAFGNADPPPEEIIRKLVVVDKWDSREDGVIDTYDFSLLGDVTNYVLAVRFDGGEVSEVEMES